ncbi:helix-turn-helix domain-containing protein [Clostridium liquoris]|jgi:putative transposase|nr:helix-turn-helix domain-containing protein [Clostridium liquoris]
MRFVYNWALARQIDSYELNSKKLSVTDLGKELFYSRYNKV